MATADQYAQWIVNNKDKIGTADFETVVKAYQQAKAEESQQQSGTLQSPQVPEYGFGQGLLGMGETALTLGTSLPATSVAGLAGLASMPFIGVRGGAELMKDIQEGGTYAPSTEAGKAMLGAISKPFQALAQGQKYIGDIAQEATGSPVVGGLVESSPDIIGAIFGLQAMRSLKPGVALKVNGQPTRELMDALNKHGIVYSQLSPQVQQSIPSVAPKNLLGGPRSAQIAEEAIVKELKAGGRQKGLAPYKVGNNERLIEDTLSQEAIRQEFSPGDVQMIKSATPETQAKMLQMLRNREAIAADSGKDILLRPSNIVGDAVSERLQFIANKASTARKELNDIAKKNLLGKEFDAAPIENFFLSKMQDLDIGFQMVNGKPIFDFKGSIIQADRSAQRALKDLADLMATGGAPDALRAHNLKRQIDALIDWKSTPQQGITAQGKSVLKGVRNALNDSLRAADPDYARVNDVMSKSLKLFDQLDDATASKITVAKTLGDSRGMGTELRKLFSNYQNRQDLDVAIRDMDELAKQFSAISDSREVGHYMPGSPTNLTTPNFNDSIVDLARFANVLDDKFGTTAKTSFAGMGEQFVKHGMRAAQSGVTNAAVAGVGEKAMDMMKRMRNIDDYNAYRSMEELLKGNQ